MSSGGPTLNKLIPMHNPIKEAQLNPFLIKKEK